MNLLSLRIIFPPVFCACVFPIALFAETHLAAFGGRNRGEHIWEAGSRLPGLYAEDGLGSGSRITYRRDFAYGGFSLEQLTGAWRFGLSFATTGWYVDSGGARDEDFKMTIASGVQEGGLNPYTYKFYDSAHTFTGTRNYADARTRATISDYNVLLPVRYYFSADEFQSGFFLGGGLRYSYFDFFVYDVVQFVDRTPIFLFPVGEGLRFSNSTLEVRGGGGYTYYLNDAFGFEAGLYGLGGGNRARDFHIQRALNFVVYEAYGSGFAYDVSLLFRFGDFLLLRAGAYGHRYYSRGLMRTTGGFYPTDVLSTFGGPFTVWIGTKEAGVDFAAAYIF